MDWVFGVLMRGQMCPDWLCVRLINLFSRSWHSLWKIMFSLHMFGLAAMDSTQVHFEPKAGKRWFSALFVCGKVAVPRSTFCVDKSQKHSKGAAPVILTIPLIIKAYILFLNAKTRKVPKPSENPTATHQQCSLICMHVITLACEMK